jgi:hypothetical protein
MILDLKILLWWSTQSNKNNQRLWFVNNRLKFLYGTSSCIIIPCTGKVFEPVESRASLALEENRGKWIILVTWWRQALVFSSSNVIERERENLTVRKQFPRTDFAVAYMCLHHIPTEKIKFQLPMGPCHVSSFFSLHRTSLLFCPSLKVSAFNWREEGFDVPVGYSILTRWYVQIPPTRELAIMVHVMRIMLQM